jgi:uncharacterized lipoprotein YmbA
MSDVRTIWRVAGCVFALALGGCRSAPTRIYILAPAAPATQLAIDHAQVLRIDTLNVPAAWDRIELLKVSTTGTLQLSDFDHWAAPLAQMARQTLSDDLDRRLPSGSVIYPRLIKPVGALGVNVDILEMDIVGSRASMRVSWIMVPSGDPKAAKRSAAELRFSMSSEDPAAVAHAWSELLGQLADRIAADAVAFNTT